MRTLDQDEKNFLSELISKSEQLGPVNLASLIDPILENKEIHLFDRSQKAEVRFDQATFMGEPDIVHIVRSTSWILIKYVNLLKYLEDTNQIYLYQEREFPSEYTYGQIPQGNAVISSEIKDPSVIRGLIYMSYRTVVLSQSIIDFVKNNFQTQDDIKHAQNLKIGEDSLKIGRESISKASTAIWISIALGVISIFVSFYLSQVNSEQKVILNKQQFKTLESLVNENTQMIIKQIESSSTPIPDTINAKIINQIEIREKIKHENNLGKK
jgi:hypothetical protein